MQSFYPKELGWFYPEIDSYQYYPCKSISLNSEYKGREVIEAIAIQLFGKPETVSLDMGSKGVLNLRTADDYDAKFEKDELYKTIAAFVLKNGQGEFSVLITPDISRVKSTRVFRLELEAKEDCT